MQRKYKRYKNVGAIPVHKKYFLEQQLCNMVIVLHYMRFTYHQMKKSRYYINKKRGALSPLLFWRSPPGTSFRNLFPCFSPNAKHTKNAGGQYFCLFRLDPQPGGIQRTHGVFYQCRHCSYSNPASVSLPLQLAPACLLYRSPLPLYYFLCPDKRYQFFLKFAPHPGF